MSVVDAKSIENLPEGSRLFTPKTIDYAYCPARMWNNGAGGQCEKFVEAGRDLCAKHQKRYESNKGLEFGRVDGPIPQLTLKKFLNHNAAGQGDAQAPRPKRGRGRVAISAVAEDEREFQYKPPPKRVAAQSWLAQDGIVTNLAPMDSRWRCSVDDIWSAIHPQSTARKRTQGVLEKLLLPRQSVSEDAWSQFIHGMLADGTDAKALTMDTDAVVLLRDALLSWLAEVIEELHALSLHRVGLVQCTATDPIDTPEGCISAYDFRLAAALRPDTDSGTRDVALEDEFAAMQQRRQRLRRITAEDIQAWLGDRICGAEFTAGRECTSRGRCATLQLPAESRERLLRRVVDSKILSTIGD